MSRVAKNPIVIPEGVKVSISGSKVFVEASKGKLEYLLHPAVDVQQKANTLIFGVDEKAVGIKKVWALVGTSRALVNNMIIGVTQGYERRLKLVGIGYRAAVKGNVLNMVLGFSHPVNFPIPAGIQVDTPTQTEVVVTGIDKYLVGQVAANIRRYRRPDAYKGKGIRYKDENIVLKEVKKK